MIEVEKYFLALGICLLIILCSSVKWFIFNEFTSCVNQEKENNKNNFNYT